MNPLNLKDKLQNRFYIRDVCTVARALLGKIIVRKIGHNVLAAKIVEVEAYGGEYDQASHSYPGITKRNEVMFRNGGSLYVYFTYGMHFCSNVVTGPEGEGYAVLIRAVEPIEGLQIMGMNRFGKKNLTEKETINLTNGPAKLTKAFGIGRAQNGTDLLGDNIFILNAPHVASKKISASKRIGIKKSVDLPRRFYITDNPFVSKK
jgi:DNA-3-methyladenine glycosylase